MLDFWLARGTSLCQPGDDSWQHEEAPAGLGLGDDEEVFWRKRAWYRIQLTLNFLKLQDDSVSSEEGSPQENGGVVFSGLKLVRCRTASREESKSSYGMREADGGRY